MQTCIVAWSTRFVIEVGQYFPAQVWDSTTMQLIRRVILTMGVRSYATFELESEIGYQKHMCVQEPRSPKLLKLVEVLDGNQTM